MHRFPATQAQQAHQMMLFMRWSNRELFVFANAIVSYKLQCRFFWERNPVCAHTSTRDNTGRGPTRIIPKLCCWNPSEGHSKLGKKNSTAIRTALWLQQQLQQHHHNTLFPSHQHHHQHHRYWALFFCFFFFFFCCCVCLSFYLSPHVCLWSNYLSFQKQVSESAARPIFQFQWEKPKHQFFLSFFLVRNRNYSLRSLDLNVAHGLLSQPNKKTNQKICWIQ